MSESYDIRIHDAYATVVSVPICAQMGEVTLLTVVGLENIPPFTTGPSHY